MTQGTNRRIEVVQADITKLAVDAIVNAANETLLGGGGVDGAIHRAAGPELLCACREIPEVRPGVRCPTGAARITPGFRLPARYVIHTVGPVWRGGNRGESNLLSNCYRASLESAREYNLHSIAFPAISCGIYGYPVDRAARLAVREVLRDLAANDLPERVVLVAFSQRVLDALRAAYRRATSTAADAV
jgi:O-acetyl-ADP-ribose deacetylase (regulator of RNase III)